MMPLVGIAANIREIEGIPLPFHGAGNSYVMAILNFAGGQPVLVPAAGPHQHHDHLLDRLDGVVLTGGAANIQPHLYGQEEAPDSGTRDPGRDDTAIALVRGALARGLPLLGICRGIQEMNVALGGTLHQHLKDVPGRFDHRRPRDKPFPEQVLPRHSIAIRPGGLLSRLVDGAAEVEINSLHGQGIDVLADRLQVEATAPDGTIEAVTVREASGFALGVQWHAEVDPATWPLHAAIFRAFGAACRDYAAKR